MAREILVANSDKGDQEEFKKIFGSSGYEVVFSESGEDALLKVKLFKPDLVIAGLGLSEKSGLELCETIKKDSESRQIPFILLTGMFEEVTEKERLRVGADGLISKPLQGGEILTLVDQLIEETRGSSRAPDMRVQPVKEWSKPPGKDKPPTGEKEAFVLEGLDEEGEEIIDLVDLVEEPEPKMSIDDFITTGMTAGKTEPVSEITPLDTWDQLFLEEEKKETEEAPAPGDVQELSLSEEEETGPPVDLKKEEALSPGEELFEKIELEEILQKVEKLQPSIEKEWPEDQEIERKIREALPTPDEDLSGKWVDLNEFERALKSGVKEEGKTEPEIEAPLSFLDTLEAFTPEQPKEELPREPAPVALEAPVPEGLPSFMETFESLPIEETKEDVSREPLPHAVEVVAEEEPLAELAGEELPLGLMEEELDESQIRFVEKVLEGVEEIPVPYKEEKTDILPSETPPRFMDAVPSSDITRELEISNLMQEVPSPSVQPDRVEPPKTYLEEIPPPRPQYNQQLGEMVGKGVQEMMEGFITKVLPEMTQSILNLTMERIEKMVREVVPDLAEKAVREEIERLQKGEKG